MSIGKQIAPMLAIELVAIDLYERVIMRIRDPYVRQQVEEVQRSHMMRRDILVEELQDLGIEPDMTVPPLPLEKLAEASEFQILNGMATTEGDWLRFYRERLETMDFDVRDLAQCDLLPEQERTHAIMTSLKEEH